MFVGEKKLKDFIVAFNSIAMNYVPSFIHPAVGARKYY
jgi:hypothetical protein